MSLAARLWAEQFTDLTQGEKFCLMCIANFYNDDEKRAWPSRETIATYTCTNVRTVARHINSLETKGLIAIQNWKHNSGGQRALNNRYYLPMFDPQSYPKSKIVFVEPERSNGRIIFRDD